MAYNELIKEAEEVYNKIAKESPFCAQIETRKFIASKIDLCSDRDNHLDILEWDEYKKDYAPMTKAEYEQRKEILFNNYQNRLKSLDKEYEEKGKNSPDWHKI